MDEEIGVNDKRIQQEGAFIVDDRRREPRLYCGRCGFGDLAMSVILLSGHQAAIRITCRKCGAVYYPTVEVLHGE